MPQLVSCQSCIPLSYCLSPLAPSQSSQKQPHHTARSLNTQQPYLFPTDPLAPQTIMTSPFALHELYAPHGGYRPGKKWEGQNSVRKKHQQSRHRGLRRTLCHQLYVVSAFVISTVQGWKSVLIS